MLVSEAFNQFILEELVLKHRADKTRRNYLSTYRSLLRSLHDADVPVELFSMSLVLQWQVDLARLGIQPSSVKASLCHLRNVLKYLKRKGVNTLDWRDIELPTVYRKDPTWLTSGEVKQLLDVIDSPRDQAIVAALFDTGARISELLSLDRDTIIDGTAHILGKGDKPGTLYFDPLSLRLIDDYLATRKDRLRPLFVSGQNRRITVSRVEQLLHTYADAAGIDKNVTPHVLRHSHASDLRLNGADIYDIKESLRHSSVSTTQIYTHITDKQRQETHRKYHTQL